MRCAGDLTDQEEIDNKQYILYYAHYTMFRGTYFNIAGIFLNIAGTNTFNGHVINPGQVRCAGVLADQEEIENEQYAHYIMFRGTNLNIAGSNTF